MTFGAGTIRDHYPLAGLRLTTPDLDLHLGGDAELAQLAALAHDGVHDPDTMPFSAPWTDAPPAERARSVVAYQWLIRARSTPSNWNIEFVVVRAGRVVGTQGIRGADFAVLRQVATGSWLGRAYHGQGIGTQMRAAVLHLAFAGLGAQRAVTEAFADNPASRRVTEKLGYRENGVDWHETRGRRGYLHRYVLSPDDWAAHRHVPVEIDGLTPEVLAEFGVG